MRCKNDLKHDKGVAGLTILLSLITFLFVIGLIITVFALMTGGLKESSTLSASDSSTIDITNLTINDGGVTMTTCDSANQGVLTGLTSVVNNTNGVTLTSGNWTISGCIVTSVDPVYNDTQWNFTYAYTLAGQGWEVANDTITGISGATDWYDIFIVIGAMVVLILLTVIIIISIRGSGLMGEGSSTGNNRNIGTS